MEKLINNFYLYISEEKSYSENTIISYRNDIDNFSLRESSNMMSLLESFGEKDDTGFLFRTENISKENRVYISYCS